jgi:AcrR family transcriptional regulator
VVAGNEGGANGDWLVGGHRADISRQRIVTAAAELFAEHGIDPVTVDDIAWKAGCSRATLYRYAGGKSRIITEVMISRAILLSERIVRAIAGLQGSDQVVEAILEVVAAVRDDRILADIAVKSTIKEMRASVAANDIPLLIGLSGLVLDSEEAQYVLRFVMSLVTLPMESLQAERDFVERFVRHAFTT